MIACAGCRQEREQPICTRTARPRTPSGWKHLRGQFWCAGCVRTRFVPRTITLPVAGPSDGSWADLRPVLREAFAETTRCANWLVTQYYLRDRPRRPEDERLSRLPAIYLYPEARILFPSLASQSLASLERQVRSRYCATRLDVLWRHAASLSTYRYPVPLPLPSRMWRLDLEGNRWHFSARLRDRRWSLRLRLGPALRRHSRIVQQVAEGSVEGAEASLCEVSSVSTASQAAGNRGRRLMVRLVVWLPRPEPTAAHGTLEVRTSNSVFVVAQIAGEELQWSLHAAHVRRWVAEAQRRQRGLRADAVHDCRLPIAERVDLASPRRRVSEKLRRRLHAWTHQATAQLIARAQRCHVAEIAWDDGERGYLELFPWHHFAATLAEKAAANGIRFSARGAGSKEVGADLKEARVRSSLTFGS